MKISKTFIKRHSTSHIKVIRIYTKRGNQKNKYHVYHLQIHFYEIVQSWLEYTLLL